MSEVVLAPGDHREDRLADITEGGRYAVSVTIDGRRLPTLQDSEALQRALHQVLGLH
jgi:hypothetical protein